MAASNNFVITLVYPGVINADNLDRIIYHLQAKVAEVIRTNAMISNDVDSSEPVVMDHCRLTTSVLGKEDTSVRKIKEHTTKLVNRYITNGVTVGYDRVQRLPLKIDQQEPLPDRRDAAFKDAASAAANGRKIYYPNIRDTPSIYGGDFRMMNRFFKSPSCCYPLFTASPPPAEKYINIKSGKKKPAAAVTPQVRPSAPSLEEYSKIFGNPDTLLPVAPLNQ